MNVLEVETRVNDLDETWELERYVAFCASVFEEPLP